MGPPAAPSGTPGRSSTSLRFVTRPGPSGYFLIVQEQNGDASSSAPSATPSGHVKYDQNGKLIDEAQMLSEAGLEIGVWVKKTKAGTDDFHGVLEGVGGGTLSIRAPGSKVSKNITYLEFRDHWAIVHDKAELSDKGVINYAETLACHSEGIALMRAWGRVSVGLEFAQAWADKHLPLPRLRVETKPEKRVYVLNDVPKGGLMIFPHSTNWAFESHSGKAPKKDFEVDPLWVDSQQKVAGKAVWIKPAFTPQSATVQSCQALTEPFWAVRRLDEGKAGQDTGNMSLLHLHHDGSMCTTYRSKSRGSLVLPGQMTLASPALTNLVDLKAEDELVWLGKWAKNAKRKETRIIYEDPKKKQKIVESAER